MANRDVKHTIYIHLLSLSALVLCPLIAHGTQKLTAHNEAKHAGVGYESYERHIPSRRTKDQNENTSIQNLTPVGNKHLPEGKVSKRPAAKNKFIRYTVLRGDTMTRISKKFNITAAEICSNNGIQNHDSIKKGMIIKIPLAKKSAAPPLHSRRPEEASPNRSSMPRFTWPLSHVVEFKKDDFKGVRPIGIIIIGKPGSSVLSSAPGVVKKIGRMRGYGNYVVINHAGRYATVYANLSEITVAEGERLHAGIRIGKISDSEKKLHFQIDYEGKPENPLKYLSKT